MEDIQIQEYTVNVEVQGYGGLSMNVKVPAKDPDEAISLACGHEPRYSTDDLYLLMVFINEEDDTSVFCTYETLEEAMEHCENLTGGRWVLVQRDLEEESGGTILRTWETEL